MVPKGDTGYEQELLIRLRIKQIYNYTNTNILRNISVYKYTTS